MAVLVYRELEAGPVPASAGGVDSVVLDSGLAAGALEGRPTVVLPAPGRTGRSRESTQRPRLRTGFVRGGIMWGDGERPLQ